MELLQAGKWQEVGFPSQSEADISYCSTLAAKGLSREVVGAMWKASGLGNMTPERRVEQRSIFNRTLDVCFSKTKAKRGFFLDCALELWPGEDFIPPLWLIKKQLLAAAVNLYVGDPDVGKSFRSNYDYGYPDPTRQEGSCAVQRRLAQYRSDCPNDSSRGGFESGHPHQAGN